MVTVDYLKLYKERVGIKKYLRSVTVKRINGNNVIYKDGNKVGKKLAEKIKQLIRKQSDIKYTFNSVYGRELLTCNSFMMYNPDIADMITNQAKKDMSKSLAVDKIDDLVDCENKIGVKHSSYKIMNLVPRRLNKEPK